MNSVYGILDPMVEHRAQFAFKGKRKHISKVNILNIAYSGQHIDIEIPYGSSNHVIVPNTVKIMFNLYIESKDKTLSVVNNVQRTLIKKKTLTLCSIDTDAIDNSDVCDMYKDLCLSKKRT